MGKSAEEHYKLEAARDKLQRMGFRYSKICEGYTYTFPVYNYNKAVPVIYCRITVDEETNRAWLNVCDDNGRLYAPYYNQEYGKNAIIQNIEKVIANELNKLEIKKVN